MGSTLYATPILSCYRFTIIPYGIRLTRRLFKIFQHRTNCKISTSTANSRIKINPTACITASIFLGTGLRKIHSIRQKITLLPSSAGMGKRLNTAKLTPIYAAISRKDCTLCVASWEVSLIVVTGPPIASKPRLPVKSSPKTLNIVPAIRPEYANELPTVSKNPKR